MKQISIILILLLLIGCKPSNKLSDITIHINILNNDEYRVEGKKVTLSEILQNLIENQSKDRNIEVFLAGSPKNKSEIDKLAELIRLTPELSETQIVVLLQSDFGVHGT